MKFVPRSARPAVKILCVCVCGLSALKRGRLPLERGRGRVTKKRREARPYQVIEDGTVRRGKLCISDGFGYIRNQRSARCEYWRCRIWRDGGAGCRGRAVLDRRTDEFFVTTPHTCGDEDFVYPPNSRMDSLT